MTEKKGTIFDIEEKQGDWFDWFESEIDMESGKVIYRDPEPETGRVCIRPSRQFYLEQQDKMKKKSEVVLNPKTRGMERIEYFETLTGKEQQESRDDLIDYVVTGFDRIFDSHGNKIECTRENKLKLAANPIFDRFIAKCMDMQLNLSLEQKEKSEKN